MRKARSATAAWLTCVLLLPTVVDAADLWIQSSPDGASPGEPVALNLYEGESLEGTERPFRTAEVGLFQRLWNGGRSNLGADEGSVPAAVFTTDRPGVQLIAFASAIGDRFCKSLVIVGEPEAGGPLRWSELGQTLEIVPQSDPVVLASKGGVLEVQILFDREPLADATVTFVPRVDPGAARSLRTDEIGVVRMRVDRPGLWLIRTSHRGVCERCDASAPEIFRSTLTLSVGTGSLRTGS